MSQIIFKKCKVHGLCEHYIQKGGRVLCKQCNIDRVTLRRQKVKRELIQYKGGKCEICGYDKCDRALQFHHIDPSSKSFGISSDGHTRGIKELKKEADKCILVCANCHAEIHDKEYRESVKEREDRMRDCKRETAIDRIEDKESFFKKLEQHYPKLQLCKEYSIAPSVLYRFLRKNNLWYDEVEHAKIDKDKLLSELIEYKNFTKVGSFYNLSDNGLRRRCRNLNIPSTHKELEEWITTHNSDG